MDGRRAIRVNNSHAMNHRTALFYPHQRKGVFTFMPEAEWIVQTRAVGDCQSEGRMTTRQDGREMDASLPSANAQHTRSILGIATDFVPLLYLFMKKMRGG